MGWINDFALEQQEAIALAKEIDERPKPLNIHVALVASSDLTNETASQSFQWAKDLGLPKDVVMSAQDRAEKEVAAWALEHSSSLNAGKKIRSYPSLTDWAGRSAVNAALVREEPKTAFSVENLLVLSWAVAIIIFIVIFKKTLKSKIVKIKNMAVESRSFRRGALLCAAYWLIISTYLIAFNDYDLDRSGDFDSFCKFAFIPPAVVATIYFGFKKLWK